MFDKKAGLRGYLDLRRQLRGRRFDALLHMQLALRASVASSMVSARHRVGFDRDTCPRRTMGVHEREDRREVARARAGQPVRLRRTPRSHDSFDALGHPVAGISDRLRDRGHSRFVTAHTRAEPLLEPRLAQLERRTLRGARGLRRDAPRHGRAVVRRPQPAGTAVRHRHRAGHAPALPQPDRQRHAARVAGDFAARDRAGVARLRVRPIWRRPSARR